MMKHIGELMKELGFNKNSSESVQRAFLKNLLQSSPASPHSNYNTSKADPKLDQGPGASRRNNKIPPKRQSPEFCPQDGPEQLSFDLNPAPKEAGNKQGAA